MPITTQQQFTFEVEIEGQKFIFPIVATDEHVAGAVLKRRLLAVIEHFAL